MGRDEITAGGVPPSRSPIGEGSRSEKRLLVPLEFEGVTIFIEESGEVELAASDDLYAVASPREALQSALDFAEGFLASLGERVGKFSQRARPDELTVALTLTFEVKGKATIVPVLLTGETGAQSGITVSALWRSLDRSKEDS